MSAIIYCDEAGFTGNNLLDTDQPYFAYATVAIPADEAASIVAKTVRDFRIAGPELKGQRLLGSNRGRKAVSFVLNQCADRALVSVWHKRYTLASKFFEHIFEPVLAEQNSIFYRCGFHQFISNVIYFEALTNSQRATQALTNFQAVLRARGSQHPDTIFPSAGLGDQYANVIRDIETFALCHRDVIAEDVAAYGADHSLYRWVLEVSLSALWTLLTMWGERLDGAALTVFCDESKPLYENRSHFEIMLGRTDRKYIGFEDKLQPLTFNLAEPLHFVSSRDHPGIQLADVFASATAYAFKNSADDQGRRWLQSLAPTLQVPVLPDAERVDLRQPEAFANALVLHELVERSVRGADMFEGMPRFIQAARQMHARFLIESELESV